VTHDPANPEEPKEPPIPKKGCWKLVVFSVVVCIASGLMALVFGTLASIPYSGRIGEHTRSAVHGGISMVEAGMAFGGSSGVLAGVLWCGVMVFRVLPGGGGRRLVNHGALWGVVVGVLSTCILHLGLKMMVAPNVPGHLLAGMGYGVPAGLILGWACGEALKEVTRRSMPPPDEGLGEPRSGA
jgi:hypothetical protein